MIDEDRSQRKGSEQRVVGCRTVELFVELEMSQNSENLSILETEPLAIMKLAHAGQSECFS
jgi:hypothetical protein